ncbi:PAS domain-containing protein [Microvirga pudoricolor]|uniref:PAS domain-containing protein n=1 Tax=Microvirga pudoricolor TaxID=2778729 RepID=UPI0019521AC3|nr:PAS domain S-box protein [Microvirga pudoricolor]MBM6593612.1 PAS domain S-box protein [Microvirga pudoricolor]
MKEELPEKEEFLRKLEDLQAENNKLRFQIQAQRRLQESVANVRLEELTRESRAADKQHERLVATARNIAAELDANRDYFTNTADLIRVVANIAADYAVIAIDREGRVTSCNIGSRRILGWDSENSANQLGSFVYTADDQATGVFESDLRTAAAEGIAVRRRWHRRADGRQFWSSSAILPVRGDDLEGYVLLLHDHADRLDLAGDVREAEDRVSRMIDDLPVMTWVIDPTGSCTFISRAWCHYTGQTREECLGLGWLDAVLPSDLKRMHEESLKAGSRLQPYQIEYRLRGQDGHYRWVLGIGAPRFSDSGSFIGYIGAVIDIHDRKLAEQMLSAVPQTDPDVLEDINEAFYALDERWRITYVNRKAEEIFGRSRDILLDQVIWSALPEWSEGPIHQVHVDAKTRDAPMQCEVPSPLPGERLSLRLYPSPTGVSVYFRRLG